MYVCAYVIVCTHVHKTCVQHSRSEYWPACHYFQRQVHLQTKQVQHSAYGSTNFPDTEDTIQRAGMCVDPYVDLVCTCWHPTSLHRHAELLSANGPLDHKLALHTWYSRPCVKCLLGGAVNSRCLPHCSEFSPMHS